MIRNIDICKIYVYQHIFTIMGRLIGVIFNECLKNVKFKNQYLHYGIDPQRDSESNALGDAPRSLFWTLFVKIVLFV